MTEDVRAVRARWVEALRSGEFKQGFCQLATPTGHCCLGVLCEVVAGDKPGSWRLWDSEPPRWISEKAGLTGREIELLQRRNDNWRWTFSAIADQIEAVTG